MTGIISYVKVLRNRKSLNAAAKSPHSAAYTVFGMRREAQDTCRLYTDLAWLWPMWGDAATEYAHYCRHVTDLIRQHARRPASTLLDMWRRIPRETGFEVHEGRYNAGDDEYTTFACVKTG